MKLFIGISPSELFIKASILPILILMVLGCSSPHDSSVSESDTSAVDHPITYIRSNRIYDNIGCLNPDAKMAARIILVSDTINPGDSIKGKFFFTTPYLRELAKCNNLSYWISATLNDSEMNYLKTNKNVDEDTLYFSLAYDSLNIQKQSNDYIDYSFRGNLTANYVEENQKWGYDSTFIVIRNVVVRK